LGVLFVAFADAAGKHPRKASISWRENGKQEEESIQKYFTL